MTDSAEMNILRQDLQRLGFDTNELAAFLAAARRDSNDIFARVDSVLNSLYTANQSLPADNAMKNAKACFVIANLLFAQPFKRSSLSHLKTLTDQERSVDSVAIALRQFYANPSSSSSQVHVRVAEDEFAYIVHTVRMLFDAKARRAEKQAAKKQAAKKQAAKKQAAEKQATAKKRSANKQLRARKQSTPSGSNQEAGDALGKNLSDSTGVATREYPAARNRRSDKAAIRNFANKDTCALQMANFTFGTIWLSAWSGNPL